MSLLHSLLRRLHRTIARPPDHLARDPRQRLRARLCARRHASLDLGLAGRDRRQRAAVHRLRRRRPSTDAQVPLFGPGRTADLLHRHERLRVVALAAARRATAARRTRGTRSRRAGRRRPNASRCWSVRVAVVLVQCSSPCIGWLAPAPRWYYWCDAWIFVGSILATYAHGPRAGSTSGSSGSRSTWSACRCSWHSRYYPSAVAVRRVRRLWSCAASSCGCERRAGARVDAQPEVDAYARAD